MRWFVVGSAVVISLLVHLASCKMIFPCYSGHEVKLHGVT